MCILITQWEPNGAQRIFWLFAACGPVLFMGTCALLNTRVKFSLLCACSRALKRLLSVSIY